MMIDKRDIISNIPMGCCSGNATDGFHGLSIRPIIKSLDGSKDCRGFFIFQGRVHKSFLRPPPKRKIEEIHIT